VKPPQAQALQVELIDEIDAGELPIRNAFWKPYALVFYSPNQKVSSFQREVVNYFCQLVELGMLRNGRFSFTLSALLHAFGVTSNNSRYFYKHLFELKDVEAWLNPFELDSECETRGIFQNVVIREGHVLLVASPWLNDVLKSEGNKFRLEQSSPFRFRGRAEATIFEMCCAYKRSGATPPLPISRWRQLLGRGDGEEHDKYFKNRQIMSRLPVVGRTLGVELRLVFRRQDRSMIQIKIGHNPARSDTASNTNCLIAQGPEQLRLSVASAAGQALVDGLLRMSKSVRNVSEEENPLSRLISARARVARVRVLLKAAEEQERRAALDAAKVFVGRCDLEAPDVFQ